MNMRFILCLISVWLSVLLQVSPVMAGDEDMNPSVYQVFDPETGYMVPVDPKTVPQHGKHTPTKDPASTVNSGGNTVPVPDQPGLMNQSKLWLGSVVALTLFGGIILVVRRRRQKS